MKQGSPSAGCHTQRPYLEILRDTMHAAFQRRPYQGPNPRSARRSNTTNVLVKYGLRVLGRRVPREDLGFHPALAYKYSGERGACKAGSSVFWSGLRAPLIAELGGGNDSESKSQNRF